MSKSQDRLFSLEDSPVSRPHKQARGATIGPTSGGSGPPLNEPFVYFDHESSSWKTFQVCIEEEWETYSGVWPAAGMMRSGTVCPLQRSVPLTSVIESSSSDGEVFPTPSSQEPGRTEFDLYVTAEGEPILGDDGEVAWNERWYHKETGQVVQRGLTQYAKMWPTPLSSDRHRTHFLNLRDRPNGPTLSEEVFRREKAWAPFYTPQARDGDSRRGVSSAASRANSGKQVSLTEQVGGQLNPEWVEWLMGFPIGWTELPQSETE